MGFGDNILATGMAKGAAARGKRIAFGDGRRIIWDHNSEAIFRGNTNVAKPGSENESDIEWLGFYRGSRLYNFHDRDRQRWIWNYAFRAQAGEISFEPSEIEFASRIDRGFILVEPNVPTYKPSAVNKQWGEENWNELVRRLRQDGQRVIQIDTEFKIPSFRHALAVMSRAALYIGPEGGLHHGAAAVGTKAVVIFGSWVPPQVTGYEIHTNLAEGVACGSLYPCPHCAAGMKQIDVGRVYSAARALL